MNAIGVRPSARAVISSAVLLAALALLPYLQTIDFDFVSFDDPSYVSENPEVQKGLNPGTVAWAFTTLTTGNWHPLTWLSHLLDVQLWGMNPGGHHFASVLWHAGNSILLFIVLLQMTGGLWRSLLTAALFAIHPLHVESVAWVAERKDVLSTFFGLLALWAYLGYVRAGGVGRYLLICGSYILSLMAKQMWVTFPFLLLLLDLWPLRRWKLWPMEPAPGQLPASRTLRRILLEKAPLFVLAAVFSGVTMVVQRSGHNVYGFDVFPLGARVSNAVVGYVAYLGKLVAPFKLAVFYPHPFSWPATTIALSAIVLLLITAVAVAHRRERPWLLIGWLWFLGTLVPVIGLVQVGNQTIADRYTYLPSIGFFIMIVWSIPAALPVRFRRALVAAAIVLVLFFTAKTWRQVSYWKNNRTLFAHAAQVTRGNYLAHQNLGNILENDGDLMGALELYRLAVAERPFYAKVNVHENIGNLLIKQGRNTAAESELKTALELNPKSSVAYNGLGSIMLLQNENQRAADYLQRAVELEPKNKGAQINYGMALVNLGRWDEAIAQLSPIAEAEPDRLLARTNLALAFAGRGELDRALAELEKILKIDPRFTAALQARDKIEAQRNLPAPSPGASDS